MPRSRRQFGSAGQAADPRRSLSGGRVPGPISPASAGEGRRDGLLLKDRQSRSWNGLHPAIALRPAIRASPEIYKEANEPRVPLKRCPGTATLAGPCPLCLTHSQLAAEVNGLAALGQRHRYAPLWRLRQSLIPTPPPSLVGCSCPWPSSSNLPDGSAWIVMLTPPLLRSRPEDTMQSSGRKGTVDPSAVG
jgi:hypothetical protein